MYDYERWLSGRFTKNATALTPAYLLQEMHKLNAHIAEIDVYRMNKELLYRYLVFLLADEKIAIIQLKADHVTISALVTAFLQSVAVLPGYFAKEVLQLLQAIAANHPAEAARIALAQQRLLRETMWQKIFPWLALLITILLCTAMYFFSKK